MIKQYELIYLITPDLTEEEIKSLIEKISLYITQINGVIEKTIGPERRRLAYSVKEKKEALLVSLIFSLSQDKVKEIFEKVKKEDLVLRHMIIIKKKEKENAGAKRRTKPIEKPVEKTAQENKDKKVEIEKISEKIDEILK